MNYLVIRTSALGDVAMVVPVLHNIVAENPEAKFTVLTTGWLAPMFENIDRVTVVAPDFKGNHKGFLGLYRLYKELKRERVFDAVLDLHSVIRSRVISSFFALSGVKIYRIDKGGKLKKQIVKTKKLIELEHSSVRYQNVFKDAGLNFTALTPTPYTGDIDHILGQLNVKKSDYIIGIAPFAAHDSKAWGEHNLEKLLSIIESDNRFGVVLFGGGSEEKRRLDEIAIKYSSVESMVGRYKFGEELKLISKLDLMLAMDSSNMHLAAISGVKVISIWGGTDPCFGFSPMFQSETNSLVNRELEQGCHPCSVYGSKRCVHSEKFCMNTITPEMVFEKILKVVINK